MAQSTQSRDTTHEVKEKAAGQFDRMADKAKDQFRNVADQAEGVANRVAEQGREVGERVQEVAGNFKGAVADGDAGHGRGRRLRPRRLVEDLTLGLSQTRTSRA